MSYLFREFKGSTTQNPQIERGLPEDELLDLVQWQTLKYFIHFAHPISGMARERSNTSPAYDFQETVTTGGTGFGIMALIAGVHRGWISLENAAAHIEKIVDFLGQSPNYHGVFPHFMHGSTGSTIPFGRLDDGADIVETSFLMMGLLSAREYFGKNYPDQSRKIDLLWDNVQWNKHIPEDRSELLWHWSAANNFGKNVAIKGWNECLITQVMAASSANHAISPDIYHASWARGSDFATGRKFGDIALPLGPEKGGPLFFAHYSFMGLDPRGLQDSYADYWVQNLSHVLINRQHCLENPSGFDGYSEQCWGLSACDGDIGYSDHSPTNDRGIVAPTAALSSMPYTPEYSLQALRHFYEDRGDRLWGAYGFYDSFHASNGWVAPGHLAIDQGPIVCMIENHRSGLLWDLFMNCPEIKSGLKNLGFTSPHLSDAAQPTLIVA